MFDYFYEWMQNLSYYLVLITAFLHMIPNFSYKKYVRFFTGVVLVIILIAPVFQIPGHVEQLNEILQAEELEQKLERIEFIQEEKENEIIVEDITIGRESISSEDKGDDD